MVELPSIVPSLSARSPKRCPETHDYQEACSGTGSRLPPTRVTMRRLGVGDLGVAGSIEMGEVKGRGGRACRSFPTGI
jgi:hypothetical protein